MTQVDTAPPSHSDPTEAPELARIRSLLNSGHNDESLSLVKTWLTANPLCHHGFALLGEVHEALGDFHSSVVAFQRALQLRELHAAYQPSEALSRLTDLEAGALGKLRPLEIDGHIFPRLRMLIKGEGITVVARAKDGHSFIKIELIPNPLKARSLAEETNILSDLTDAGCLTTPRLLGRGSLSIDILRDALTESERETLSRIPAKPFPYLIQEFLPSDRGYNLADIALAMIEQKAFGIFHGDIQPENIRFDAKRGLCRFIDFDQAERIDPKTQALGNRDYFEWCSERARIKYKQWNHAHFLAYFPNVDFDRDFWPLFQNDALDLAKTHLFRNQITTADKGGIYHSIDTPHAFIKGERNLDSRRPILDQIEFSPGETALDVGCGSGILSIYLAQRGCKVTGVEIDAKLLSGSQIVAHLLGLPISYLPLDLDNAAIPGEFDTIALFSVIHHTKNLKENGRKVAAACRRRILIECRLLETGLKYIDGNWENSSAWNYKDLPEMIVGLEDLFPDFRFSKNYGHGDRNRYILEFQKNSVAHAC